MFQSQKKRSSGEKVKLESPFQRRISILCKEEQKLSFNRKKQAILHLQKSRISSVRRGQSSRSSISYKSYLLEEQKLFYPQQKTRNSSICSRRQGALRQQKNRSSFRCKEEYKLSFNRKKQALLHLQKSRISSVRRCQKRVSILSLSFFYLL